MNNENLIGNWNQLKGKVIEQWGKLTDSDIDEVAGKSQNLIGLLEKKYGYTKEQAEKEFRNFMNKTKQTGAHAKEAAVKIATDYPLATIGIALLAGVGLTLLLRK